MGMSTEENTQREKVVREKKTTILGIKDSAECEKAKNENSTVSLNGENLNVFFAPSNALVQHRSVVSEDKLYVKILHGVSKNEVIEKLSDLAIVEPPSDE